MIQKAQIFYISRNSGHYHAASAVEKGMKELLPGVEVTKINALSYTNPILEKIINKAYLEVIKKKPELWGHIYDNRDVMKKTKNARETLHRFNKSKIKKLIETDTPDVVICTQAFPCGMVADYKAACGSDIPLIGVLTDHAPHSYWLFPEVDYYVVPSEATAEVLKDKGVPSRKIKVYGIPVDPKFMERHDAAVVKKSLGLEGDDPVVLIMGGSQGLGAVEQVVKSLLKDEQHRYQLIVIAGSNKKLLSRLKKLKKKKKGGKIKLLSYVDNIDEIMEISDILVTKAGGMTTSEALVKGLPILVVNPIPGHERMNADYLVSKGASVDIDDHAMIHREINELFDTKGALEKMRDSISIIAKPNSARDTAKLIVNL